MPKPTLAPAAFLLALTTLFSAVNEEPERPLVPDFRLTESEVGLVLVGGSMRLRLPSRSSSGQTDEGPAASVVLLFSRCRTPVFSRPCTDIAVQEPHRTALLSRPRLQDALPGRTEQRQGFHAARTPKHMEL